MNGAQALIRTLVDSGVDVCFTNPGTSEMHFVAALDAVPEMRGVLGAVRGRGHRRRRRLRPHGRRPAATLLHLGPGLGNGLANLHNARRARTPIVNIVGDHATYHKQYDAPLESDIESGGSQRLGLGAHVAAPAATSLATRPRRSRPRWARPARWPRSILPADVSWREGARAGDAPAAGGARRRVADDVVDAVAKALRSGEPAALLLGGSALRERGLRRREPGRRRDRRQAAGRDVPRAARARRRACRRSSGSGTSPSSRIAQLDGHAPPRARRRQGAGVVLRLSGQAELSRARRLRGARARGGRRRRGRRARRISPTPSARTPTPPLQAAQPPRPTDRRAHRRGGRPTRSARCCPRARSSPTRPTPPGCGSPAATAGAPRHDWLTLTGGAIGQGLPAATGAAVACPDRKVVCLEADGSAMYTLQALWTQAREGLDVTTVIFNNRSYAILNLELSRVGAEVARPQGARHARPLAVPTSTSSRSRNGMGVDAARATTAEEVVAALERGLASPGPYLVDAVLPARL